MKTTINIKRFDQYVLICFQFMELYCFCVGRPQLENVTSNMVVWLIFPWPVSQRG